MLAMQKRVELNTHAIRGLLAAGKSLWSTELGRSRRSGIL
jgi:hypothetical protein